MTIRLNYHVSVFKHMDVAANGSHLPSDIAPERPLVKVFRNHPGWGLMSEIMQMTHHLSICFSTRSYLKSLEDVSLISEWFLIDLVK